ACSPCDAGGCPRRLRRRRTGADLGHGERRPPSAGGVRAHRRPPGRGGGPRGADHRLGGLSATTPGQDDGVRVLIAPDKFAGTLTAVEAARAIADGWARW